MQSIYVILFFQNFNSMFSMIFFGSLPSCMVKSEFEHLNLNRRDMKAGTQLRRIILYSKVTPIPRDCAKLCVYLQLVTLTYACTSASLFRSFFCQFGFGHNSRIAFDDL